MTFLPGQSGNPLGRQSAGSKLQARLDYWLNNRTAGELKALVENEAEWDKLPSIDAVLARRITEAMKEMKDNTKDFCAVLDYYAGKPKQALVGGDDGDAPLFPAKVEIVLVASKREKSDAIDDQTEGPSAGH